MSYPFSQAVHYSRGYKTRKAIFVHMAEGGGTVSWLRNPDNPNVSAHYVVEYSGRVVQMVREIDSAWGINPSLLRTTNDTAFTFLGESVRYGVTAAKAALGSFWYDPNAAGITIEVEGFASAGPNAAQRTALKALVANIRRGWGNLPVLGHRDFQNYKACPGKKIAWVDFGGHAKGAAAPAPTPLPDTSTEASPLALLYGEELWDVPEGLDFYDAPGGTRIGQFSKAFVGVKAIGAPMDASADHVNWGWRAVVVSTGAIDGKQADKVVFVDRNKMANPRPIPTPVDTTPFSQADLDHARADATNVAKAAAQVTINQQAGVIASLTAQVSNLKNQLAAAILARDAAEALVTKAQALKDALAAFTA